jgi:hypothetical protein
MTCATRVALLWPGSVSQAKGRAVLPVYRGGGVEVLCAEQLASSGFCGWFL